MAERPGGATTGPRPVVVLVGLLAAAALAVTAAMADLPAPGGASWPALPVLAAVLLAATLFVVPFRYGGSVDAVNLVEAALAPLLLAYPPLVVVAVVAASQVANALVRRLSATKAVFNTAMWVVAAGLGAAVVARFGPGPLWPHRIGALVAALAVVGLVNALAFSAAMAVAEGQGLRRLLARVMPITEPGWLGGWAVNVAVGTLFAVAYTAWPLVAVLFAVPLGMLHLAHRSHTAARADQALLAAAHRAARRLTEPLEPLAAIPEFLRAVLTAFDAGAAELVLRGDGCRTIHRVERVGGRHVVRDEDEAAVSLEGALGSWPGPVRIDVGGTDPLARALAASGARACLAAPLLDGERLLGALAVFDRGGFEGTSAGELAIVDGLAREAAGALAKGRLLADVLEERRTLAEIVGSASDGICTFAVDGTVLSWNPALEQLTGLAAVDVVGRDDVVERLRVRTAEDRPLDVRAAAVDGLPVDVRLTAADGTSRHLMCSYSAGSAADGGAALVVVARDVTPVEEQEALRAQLNELVEAEAARRAVVEQLQQAVVPAPLAVPGAELAAAYEASDSSAPTGGDLYDWQVTASGEVHIAVVDVLGHGVAATKDALAVVHTLRVVTADGTPLEEVVARADELLGAQHPELVATVIVARYDPSTGRLRVAAGGHPPALVVTPRREVVQVPASGGVIGWPGAGSDAVSETVLEPGDALVLYTDGLVEASKNILDGMEALVRHAAEVADLPAAELARELVDRALAGADRRDDTLALVLRRDPVTTAQDQVTWEWAPDAAQARAARLAVQDWLRRRGVADDTVAAVATVAGELLSNATRCARSRVGVRLELASDHVILDVADDGHGSTRLPALGMQAPDVEAEGGRGLFLARACSEHLDVLSTAEGSTVRAVMTRQSAATEGARRPARPPVGPASPTAAG